MYLAENLKFLRKQHGWNQEDVAAALDIKPSTIGNYELSIREPNIKTLIEIAQFFSVSIDDLLLKKLVPEKPVHIRNLIFLRKRENYTQEYVAKCLDYKGVSPYSKIESADMELSVENLIKLADLYKISLDTLTKKDLSKEADES